MIKFIFLICSILGNDECGRYEGVSASRQCLGGVVVQCERWLMVFLGCWGDLAGGLREDAHWVRVSFVDTRRVKMAAGAVFREFRLNQKLAWFATMVGSFRGCRRTVQYEFVESLEGFMMNARINGGEIWRDA